MLVQATTALPQDTDADTAVIGVLEDETIHHDIDGVLNGLVEAGEAKAKHRHLAVTHAGAKRWILVGLGKRSELDGERVRCAAASALGRARELGARRLCWEVPHKVEDEIAAAIVEGTLLTAYRYDRFKGKEPDRDTEPDERKDIDALLVSAHDDMASVAADAEIVASAVNAARDLQNAPPNEMAPRHVADAARALGELDGVSVEVEGRDGLERLGMGSFAAVAQGSDEEPALITLRYDGTDATGPLLGLVGKAVTFDTGGISIKPANKMSEMKFDMSGGAAVLGAVEAIARLRLPVRLVAIVGATENMPSGHAMRPGDIVRASNGVTIEIINTDAEGRLVLADCLAYAVEQGAERLVDIATLTGAIVTALGNAHAGLLGDDDAWVAQVATAGTATGENTWRLPLHRDYAKQVESEVADLRNADESRKAGSITAAQFLARFTGDVPWAHLDIAGTAWGTNKPYAAKGGTGFGVRLFVELARSLTRDA
ncbi:MAG: leucyl aminopeptidase [Actinomycetota bacterium]|nr:leucyl aminopeptidase [Actinomycetota bacterium]